MYVHVCVCARTHVCTLFNTWRQMMHTLHCMVLGSIPE